jgi:hypothetical protein
MPFIVKAAKAGFPTASWLAPQTDIGCHTLGPRKNATVFATESGAQTAADEVAKSLWRLYLVFSVESADCCVIKLVYGDVAISPQWVHAESDRGLGTRAHATVFPDREAAQLEAEMWKVIAKRGFSVLVDPA